jgi:hypothetical protein
MFVVTLLLFALNNVTPMIYGDYKFKQEVTLTPTR